MTDVLAGAAAGIAAGQLTYEYGYQNARTGSGLSFAAMSGATGLAVSYDL